MDSPSGTIEVYWRPGCSSCLRTKEFVQKTGLDFVEVNVETAPAKVAKLEALGLSVPCVVVGDRGVHGLDLGGVAQLIGYDYDPPVILPPAVLHDRFLVVSTTLSRLVAQVPTECLGYKSPDRDRPLSVLAAHAGLIMRSFLSAYEDDVYPRYLERPDPTLELSVEDLVGRIDATRAMFEKWWDTLGYDDPLDRVVETEWGHRTLHEIFERAVWHVAQHTRQMAMFLGRIGVVPDSPLTDSDLEGLPLPEGIHAGIES